MGSSISSSTALTTTSTKTEFSSLPPLPTLTSYFAYGSNMSVDQMAQRDVPWSKRFPCAIRNYRLAFNHDGGTKSHANIMSEPSSIVYGIVYEGCNHKSFTQLDIYEGVKSGKYYREEVDILVPVTESGFWKNGVDGEYGVGERREADSVKIVRAVVYIAGPGYIKEGLLPERAYLNRILKGEEYLPKPYFEKIKETPTQLRS
ncbi:hypothetical protein G9A89_017833 [Geosiphon pyriformis]|nr:hypothetical protein G9A89_017833 [Geosiphon pyriformis]